MRSFVAALRFLTVLPIPGRWGDEEADLARGAAWFPLVGLLLGAVAAGAAYALPLVAPPLVCASLMVILLAGFSGCLHLDGLADTADGLLSSRPRERILEIMKDSHVGAMGVIAIVGALLLKFAALASAREGEFWRISLIMPLAGRCAIMVQMALLPNARPGGLSSVFYRRRPRLSAVGAVGLVLLVCWAALGWRGLAAGGASIGLALLFSAYVYRKIGGATGDTFGATCEIAEAVPALVLVLVPLAQAR